jgi:hypothetical protein
MRLIRCVPHPPLYTRESAPDLAAIEAPQFQLYIHTGYSMISG